MDHFTYCRDVCGAKCCKHHATQTLCPQLADDKSCKCYKERYADGMGDLVYVGSVEINDKQKIDFMCGRIEQMIAKGQLPEEIIAQCCYAHPQLLKAKL